MFRTLTLKLSKEYNQINIVCVTSLNSESGNVSRYKFVKKIFQTEVTNCNFLIVLRVEKDES